MEHLLCSVLRPVWGTQMKELTFQQHDYWFCCSSLWPSRTDLHGAHAVFQPLPLWLFAEFCMTFMAVWPVAGCCPALPCAVLCCAVCINVCSHRQHVSPTSDSVPSDPAGQCTPHHLQTDAPVTLCGCSGLHASRRASPGACRSAC